MRVISAILIVVLIGACPEALAAGYTISRIVEVGPGGGPVVGSVNWSPDGTQLAFFRGSQLYVSDTLGASRLVIDLGATPYRCEWATNNSLVLMLLQQPSGVAGVFEIHKLVSVDISNGAMKLIKEYLRKVPKAPDGDSDSFIGPKLTLEGKAYYQTNVVEPTIFGPAVGKVLNLSNEKSSAFYPGNNHYVDWGKDGLYRFSVDKHDSVKIAPKPYDNMIGRPILSSDMSYYVHGGTVYRFADSTYIVLDTIVKRDAYPPGTILCGFSPYGTSFNPVAQEILFELGCENGGDGPEYSVTRIGTFNLLTHEFTIINTLIGRTNCSGPSFSPDGTKISCNCDGLNYILYLLR